MYLLNNIQKNRLSKIITDKTSGSSELVNRINNFFRANANHIEIINESIPIFKTQLNHFAAVSTYLNRLKKIINSDDKLMMKDFLSSFANGEKNKYEIIFNKLYKKTKQINSIITISKSGT